MDARSTVVNGELTLRPTSAAATTVARENRLPVSGEAPTGIYLPVCGLDPKNPLVRIEYIVFVFSV
jgi:hypothetical protein